MKFGRWGRRGPDQRGATSFGPELESRAHRVFDPSADTLTRVRASVVSSAGAVPRSRQTYRRRDQLRLVAGTAFVTAAVVLAVSLTGSGPGGPLYSARLAVESWTLPGAPAARYQAELRLLDERFAELTAALAAGQPDAASAASAAYQNSLSDLMAMTADGGGDPSLLSADLDRQSSTLHALIAAVPDSTAGLADRVSVSVDDAQSSIAFATQWGDTGPTSSVPSAASHGPTVTPDNGNGQGATGHGATSGAPGSGAAGHGKPTPTPAAAASCSDPTFRADFSGTGKGVKAHQMTFHGTERGVSAGAKWNWRFGDGTGAGSGAAPKHAFTAAGRYVVTLTVADASCGSRAVTAAVTVP